MSSVMTFRTFVSGKLGIFCDAEPHCRGVEEVLGYREVREP